MKLSEMRQLLATGGIRLTKSLGQNFLHDANQLRRIVEAAELKMSDRVLEIGPGLGPLTELLLARAGEVLAIEKDARLAAVLRERFTAEQASPGAASARFAPGNRFSAGFDEYNHEDVRPEAGRRPVLHLIQDDALEYLKREQRDWRDWKLVANLPYSVASPILVELAHGDRRPQRMVATLQMEVARRLLARPRHADYSVLTLLIQLGYQPLGWFKIAASCFFPEPDVDSACVTLVRREPPPLATEQRATFARIVKRSFSQRRKMMLKLLKEDWPEARLKTEFNRMKLSLQTRAEEVTLAQFIQLAQVVPDLRDDESGARHDLQRLREHADRLRGHRMLEGCGQ